MSTKTFGTLCSRQKHFVKFLHNIKLGNNVALKSFTLTVRNIIMACYTAYLATGETLLCRTIKANTIKKYLDAAAELSLPAKLLNPCLDIRGDLSIHIKEIIREIKRWEKIPNRREPVTKQMVEYIINKGLDSKKENPDNIYLALGNWLVLGEQTGFRRKEWAQDMTYLKKYKGIERNIDGSSAAFIMNDLEFRMKNNKRLNNKYVKQTNKATMINIKWRFQKNNDNGQVISYVEDPTNKIHCAVEASKTIYKRAIKLKIEKDMPIAVYTEVKNGKKKICYIDDVHIKSLLQEAAKEVYKISKKDDLAKFSAHSIRVGACVLLHAQNISTEDIKFRLRWRSDSFRMYLRNIVQLAERHKDAIANAA